MKKLFSWILLNTLMFNASFAPTFQAPDYLITEIRIVSSGSPRGERRFTDQESMGAILQYLRSAVFFDGEEETSQPAAPAPAYEITLIHSTGRVTTYTQISDRYLAKGHSGYHLLDREYGRQLEMLYRTLPDNAYGTI